MKKHIQIALTVFFAIASFGQSKTDKVPVTTIPLARVTCTKTTHDFGKIPQGTPVTFVFQFKNEGKKQPIRLTIFDKELSFEEALEIVY